MAWKVIAAALLVASHGAAVAQAPEKGRLLVATEEMRDPNYQETVVLLLHHDQNGTIGVAINRPTWLAPADVVPQLALEGYDGKVYRGGPLSPGQLIFLVRNPAGGTFDAPPILDRIYASGNLQLLPRLAPAADGERGLRLYAGHSEWAAGQVEQEIADGDWVVVDGSEDRVFAEDTEGLWRRVLVSGGELLVGSPL